MVQSGKVVHIHYQQQVTCDVVELPICQSFDWGVFERRYLESAFRVQGKVSRQIIDMDGVFGGKLGKLIPDDIQGFHLVFEFRTVCLQGCNRYHGRYIHYWRVIRETFVIMGKLENVYLSTRKRKLIALTKCYFVVWMRLWQEKMGYIDCHYPSSHYMSARLPKCPAPSLLLPMFAN